MARVQRGFEPVLHLADTSPLEPEEDAGRSCESHGQVRPAVAQRPGHGRTEVVELVVEAVGPRALLGAPESQFGLLRQLDVVQAVPSPKRRGFTLLVQALGRVLPDRREQIEPCASVLRLTPHGEVLGDQ